MNCKVDFKEFMSFSLKFDGLIDKTYKNLSYLQLVQQILTKDACDVFVPFSVFQAPQLSQAVEALGLVQVVVLHRDSFNKNGISLFHLQ